MSGSAEAQWKKIGVHVSSMEQPQQEEYQSPRQEQAYGIYRCSTHPDVETGLACGTCGKYICPRCMIQTPVGARCGDCARVTRHPTFDVTPSYYLRASVAGGVVGVVAGVVWGWGSLLGIPFLPWLLAIGTGYAVGEVISMVSNRKRGSGLAVVAGVSLTLAVISSLTVASWSLASNIFWLLLVALAFYTAINRVR